MARLFTNSLSHEVLSKSGIEMCPSSFEKVSHAALNYVKSKGIGNEKATKMVFGYYMSVFTYIDHLSDTIPVENRPLIIGISAPQGKHIMKRLICGYLY